MRYFLSIDLEMSGTEPGWHEIIQVGACLYDENWNELGQYLQNVYPENEESFSIPAARVHDLSWHELQEAPMLHEVLVEFEKWICEKIGAKWHEGKNFRNILIAGQSVINDINFMKFAYRQEKMNWPFSNVLLDLHTLSFFLFRIFKNNGFDVPRSLSLDSIANYFGYEREGDSHNALEDAIITGKCMKEVMEYADTLQLEESEEED